jgi:hypothetical protein
MRIWPLVTALIAFASTAEAASTTTRNFGVRSFEKIRVEGPYRVSLKTGVAPFARAKGPASALDRLDFEMRGKVLVIRSGPFAKNPAASALAPVEIEIGTHELSSAAVTGSGSLAIDKVKGLKFDLTVLGAGVSEIGQVAVDQLSLNLGGNAAARLSGKSKQLTAVLRGLSTLDTSGLVVPDAEIGAEGPSTVRATITKAAKIDAKGTASFALAGRPSCTLKIQGSVSVSGCK